MASYLKLAKEELEIPSFQEHITSQYFNLRGDIIIKILQFATGKINVEEDDYKNLSLSLRQSDLIEDVYFKDEKIGILELKFGYEADDFKNNQVTGGWYFTPSPK